MQDRGRSASGSLGRGALCRWAPRLTALWIGLALADPSGLATELLAIRAPGSDRWDAEVAFRLEVDFDRNRSGRLERAEIRRVPCDVWQAMNIALVEGSPYPGLQRTYGFTREGPWLAGALGISERDLRMSARRLERCGLRPPAGVSAAEETYLLTVLQDLPAAGQPAWEGIVAAGLVATYDRDANMLVDPLEVMEMDCAVVVALELSLVKAGGSLAAYLDDPGTIGISSAGALAERIESCILP